MGRHATRAIGHSRCGVGNLCSVQLALSASVRIDLLRGIRFAGDADQRVGRRPGDFARTRLSAAEAKLGAEAFSANPDALLVEHEGWHASISLPGRRRALAPSGRGCRPGPHFGSALVFLPVPVQRLRRFSWISVGYSAARDRIPGCFCRAVRLAASLSPGRSPVAGHSMASLVVAVSADVLVRVRQIAQRRPTLAGPDRAEVSL